MSEQRTIDEVRVAIDVAVPLDHAFRVFTEQFDTRVELRHHGLARHGAGWESAAVGLEEGWPLYLQRLERLCIG